jgi:N-acetylglucosamine kinase
MATVWHLYGMRRVFVGTSAGYGSGQDRRTGGRRMIVAFDIGGSRIRAARVAGGVVTSLGEVATPTTDAGAFAAAMAGFLVEATAVAVSIAGVVEPESGRITVANIPCLDGRPVAAELQARLGLPVLILNDADCFALAEARQGAGRGHASVFGIILGTGVGGGLVINGQLVTGAGGFAGEWGHGPIVAAPALPCGCGQIGCLDTVGGARGMERLHLALTGEALEARQVVATRPETLARWLELVSGPLAMVLNVVGASVVPVGGGLSNDRALVAMLDRAVRARVLRKTAVPIVVPAECGADAGLIGAAEAGFAAFGGAL